MSSKVKYPATLLCDFYKLGHPDQYPEKTEYVYSTWIPRTSRLAFANKVVAFGFQGFIKEYLIDYFNENFFSRPLEEVVAEFERYLVYALGIAKPDSSRIKALHSLGYLPVLVKAVPEGTLVPVRVPMLTIENTHPEFGWITNFFETLASCSLWQPSTSATIALEYKRIFDKYASETSDIPEFTQFQGHDFSMRGMGHLGAACTSGGGHLLPFVGTDTIPAIAWLEAYYNANIEKELVGCSVWATEHSVMCAGGKEDEYGTYLRLITEVYPTGIISIVSDTWDLWNTVTNILPRLKDKIMARDGKVVIRPDSGDPADILCGICPHDYSQAGTIEVAAKCAADHECWKIENDTPHGEHGECGSEVLFYFRGKVYTTTLSIDWNRYDKQYYYVDGHSNTYPTECVMTPAQKGLIQLLWETFGGTVNQKGFKQLDPHIGAIYGDSITPDRAEDIMRRLKAKGFASTNVVLGIGSYTYQYNTRDTFGFAMKSTHCVIAGKEVNIFKDPATDTDKIKKSLTGRCVVHGSAQGIMVTDGLTVKEESDWTEDGGNILRPIFKDGTMLVDDTIHAIRGRLAAASKV